MDPKCPSCRAIVSVSRATLLMADHSRPAPPMIRKAAAREP
jgi:hypothetical protein